MEKLPPNLQELVESGRATPATQPGNWPKIPVPSGTYSLDAMLEDDRGDD